MVHRRARAAAVLFGTLIVVSLAAAVPRGWRELERRQLLATVRTGGYDAALRAAVSLSTRFRGDDEVIAAIAKAEERLGVGNLLQPDSPNWWIAGYEARDRAGRDELLVASLDGALARSWVNTRETIGAGVRLGDAEATARGLIGRRGDWVSVHVGIELVTDHEIDTIRVLIEPSDERLGEADCGRVRDRGGLLYSIFLEPAWTSRIFRERTSSSITVAADAPAGRYRLDITIVPVDDLGVPVLGDLALPSRSVWVDVPEVALEEE